MIILEIIILQRWLVSQRQRWYPYQVRFGYALRVFAANFNIQGNIQLEWCSASLRDSDSTPVPTWQEMLILEWLAINILRENGDHIFVGIGVEMMNFVASVPVIFSHCSLIGGYLQKIADCRGRGSIDDR